MEACTGPILQVRKARLEEVKTLAQVHAAIRWDSLGLACKVQATVLPPGSSVGMCPFVQSLCPVGTAVSTCTAAEPCVPLSSVPKTAGAPPASYLPPPQFLSHLTPQKGLPRRQSGALGSECVHPCSSSCSKTHRPMEASEPSSGALASWLCCVLAPRPS